LKKRILFIGEASFLSTGFSTYYRELLPRLVATGKYEIAELGSYAKQDDPRIKEFINGRWKFYGVMPSNPEEAQKFQTCPNHPRNPQGGVGGVAQFGAWNFDSVLVDFQPDVVIDIRDWWMLEYQERSVFRSWYKWCIMPTVDAEPQKGEWIQTYENANLVLAYSDYGVHTLRRQTVDLGNGRHRMKIFPKAMRPGVDLDTFKPVDHHVARDYWNINKNIPIIGTVMRNQSRKLYPDLIDAFALMKNKYEGDDAVGKAALLIHSAWPDNAHSYDYPRHVMRLESYEWMKHHRKGIRGDILQSMYCTACNKPSIGHVMNLWNRPIQEGRIKLPCPYCGQNEASPPSTHGGFNREELAMLYNLLDLYVQSSICEGDGMPIQEAKACGVPTLVTDYTAMREKGRYPEYDHFDELGYNESNYTCNKGGQTIDVGRYYHEPETSCLRAHPSVEDMADKMYALISDKQKLTHMGQEARECAEENYDWDKLWKQWEYILDNIKPLDRTTTWDSPIGSHDAVVALDIPDGLDDNSYVEWLYLNVLKYPAVDPDGARNWVEHLRRGITREQLMQQFVSIGNQQADSTQLRDQIRSQAVSRGGVGEKRVEEFI
jgi:glycosyltransferase involved in cell wall biosynthesis